MSLTDSPVTITLIFANVAISLWALYSNPIYFVKFAEWPHQVVYNKSIYQVITSAFLHANLPHLFFNMLALFSFGITLEQFWNAQFGFMNGSLIFLIIYFVSLLVGSVFTVLLHYKDPNYVAVGASGAVSGVVFSYIIYSPTSTIFVLFFPMPAWLFAVLWIAFSIYGMKSKLGNIGHEAHLGGAAAGFLSTLFFVPGAMQIFLSHFS
ncbi:MAG TPA: rhomboid family intramembrane serine protease [Ignavibacteria bacterium]|nr:rhomboid family intramembrane serine protease [Ignavibacteria bacterium]